MPECCFRKTVLYAAVFLFILCPSILRADTGDAVPGPDWEKEQVWAEYNALFGNQGSLLWLVNGGDGPQGAPDTEPLMLSQPEAVLDAGTYISVENEQGAASWLNFDDNSQPVKIETNGYLRSVFTGQSTNWQTGAYGLSVMDFSSAQEQTEAPWENTIANNGAIYALATDLQGDQSQSEIPTQAAAIRMNTNFSVLENQVAGINRVVNEGILYAETNPAYFAWSIGAQIQNNNRGDDGGSPVSFNILENHGKIFGRAQGNEALVDGMYSYSRTRALDGGDAGAGSMMENTGLIWGDAVASEGKEDAWTTGMASELFVNTNSGGTASAISAFLNTGAVYARETGGDAEAHGIYSNIEADAFYGEQSGGGDVRAMFMAENSGALIAEASGAEGSATGIYLDMELTSDQGGNITASSTINNDGTIDAMADGLKRAIAYGMISETKADFGENGGFKASGSMTNSGKIRVRVNGNEQGWASGMLHAILDDVEIDYEHILKNSGTIDVQTQGDFCSASGIESYVEGSGPGLVRIENTGYIFVSTGTAEESYPTGIALFNNQETKIDVTNSGFIHVIAEGDAGNAGGIYASYGTGTIVNTGNMMISGASGAGIIIDDANVRISNPGNIYSINGARTLQIGYEDYQAGAVLDGDFRIVFIEDPDENNYAAPILVNSAGTLDLNGSNLIASASDNISWNKSYGIMENNGGTVKSEFGDLILGVAHPDVDAAWTGPDTGENAGVSFSYNPETNPMAQAAAATRQAAEASFGLVQNRISAQTAAGISGQPRSETDQAAFVRPFLNTANRSRDKGMGYDTATVGFMAGYEKYLSSSLMLGLHGGAGKMNLDFKGSGFKRNSQEVDLFSAGAHGIYLSGNWFVQAASSFYTARHDYKGATGMNLDLDEKDKYTSYGTQTILSTGYGLNFGKLAFIPEAGITHSWIRGQSHTTDTEIKQWNIRYSSYDDHVIKSVLGARIAGSWEIEGMKVTPGFGIRWEEALSDNDISISQAMAGAGKNRLSEDIDDTVVLTDLSLLLSKQNVNFEIRMTHEQNNDYSARGGSVKFTYLF
jgi:hypothetical protein